MTLARFEPAGFDERKPRIRLVVLDFDDTLYDWIGHFVPALNAMIATAAPLLDISEETLREELKAVHRYYCNTEQPFALLETRSAQAKYGDLAREGQKMALAQAFAAFDQVRSEKLNLYDDVEPALTRLRESGVVVVGYSAATSVNIAKRIKMLGLQPYFDRVYASTYTGMPYPGRRSKPTQAVPIIELDRPKPDVGAVSRITTDLAVPPWATLFVGDSLASDIAPALAGGAWAVLVNRSASSTRTMLTSLLEVSHRRAETRADSSVITAAQLVRVPAITSLSRLWDRFEFDCRDEGS